VVSKHTRREEVKTFRGRHEKGNVNPLITTQPYPETNTNECQEAGRPISTNREVSGARWSGGGDDICGKEFAIGASRVSRVVAQDSKTRSYGNADDALEPKYSLAVTGRESPGAWLLAGLRVVPGRLKDTLVPPHHDCFPSPTAEGFVLPPGIFGMLLLVSGPRFPVLVGPAASRTAPMAVGAQLDQADQGNLSGQGNSPVAFYVTIR
jgi:hypothetical protein